MDHGRHNSEKKTKQLILLSYRNCIGMRFALLETKIMIVKALRVVAIERCEKTQVNL